MQTLRLALLVLGLTLLLPSAALAAAPAQDGGLSPAMHEKKALREREARRKDIDKQRAKAYKDDRNAKKKRTNVIVVHPE